MTELQQHSWPGNVRELRNVIERAVILASGPTLSLNLGGETRPRPKAGSSLLADVQAAHILSVLDDCGWRVRGPNGAATRLGLPPSTLESRMAKLGIRRATYGAAGSVHATV